MSDDVIGDEAIEMTLLDWATAIAIVLFIICWIGFLCMLAWSGIEWVISL